MDSDSETALSTDYTLTEKANTSMGLDSEAVHSARIGQLLTPLRESIINKPPYISGTLRLPASYFSLFYRVTKDDHNARLESDIRGDSLTNFVL